MMHALGWLLGTYPTPHGTSAMYQFWSGIAPGISIVSLPFGLYYRHNCHVKGCWHIGRHTEGGSLVCRRHRGL